MKTVLIADREATLREELNGIVTEAGYKAVTADSMAEAMKAVLKRQIRVVVLGSGLDSLSLPQVVPVLKKCCPSLIVILVSDEASLSRIRRFRREGIFYHALRPMDSAGREELLEAVRCAFEKERAAGEGQDWRPAWPLMTLNPE